jgi:hypothetical protein
MDQTCAKCGSPVGDGVAFCPQCKAPQIRVAVAPAMDAPAPSDWTLGSVPRPIGTSAGALGIIWQQALPAAAKGGVLSALVAIIAGLLGGPELGAAMLLGPAVAIGAGFAVFLYRSRTHGLPISASGGAKIGAASAVFSFLIVGALMLTSLMVRGDEIRAQLPAMLSQAPSQGYSPEQIQQMSEFLKSDSGFAAFTILVFGCLLLIFLAAGTLGGAMYVAFSRRR